jgi:hypothetical protein
MESRCRHPPVEEAYLTGRFGDNEFEFSQNCDGSIVLMLGESAATHQLGFGTNPPSNPIFGNVACRSTVQWKRSAPASLFPHALMQLPANSTVATNFEFMLASILQSR